MIDLNRDVRSAGIAKSYAGKIRVSGTAGSADTRCDLNEVLKFKGALMIVECRWCQNLYRAFLTDLSVG